MSQFPTDCLSSASIQPNSTVLASIAACQAAADTPYCFPPNGSRICVSAEEIPIFWPTSYFNPDSELYLSCKSTPDLILPLNNAGNTTRSFNFLIFDSVATSISGKQYEKSLEVLFLQRTLDEQVAHDGPTIILVKTAEPSSTSASSRPAATAHYDSGDESDEDDEIHLPRGAIAGIVVGVLLIGLLSAYCCCWKAGCCGCRPKRQQRITVEEGAKIEQHDVELAGQKSGVVTERARKPEDIGGVDDITNATITLVAPTNYEMAVNEQPPPRYSP